MKTRNWLLFVLAVALVLCASVGAASAYFTANAAAKGGYVVHIKPDPSLDEKVTDHKEVIITNKEGASAVFVRVRAFTGAQYQDLLKYEGENWFEEPDGFWYYAFELEGGASTTPLNISLSKVFPADAEIGEHANVTVVYERAPAVFSYNGEPDFATAFSHGT